MQNQLSPYREHHARRLALEERLGRLDQAREKDALLLRGRTLRELDTLDSSAPDIESRNSKFQNLLEESHTAFKELELELDKAAERMARRKESLLQTCCGGSQGLRALAGLSSDSPATRQKAELMNKLNFL